MILLEHFTFSDFIVYRCSLCLNRIIFESASCLFVVVSPPFYRGFSVFLPRFLRLLVMVSLPFIRLFMSHHEIVFISAVEFGVCFYSLLGPRLRVGGVRGRIEDYQALTVLQFLHRKLGCACAQLMSRLR